MEQLKKKNKVMEFIRGDLWIVLLDILAVNAAYFLALVVRFYVHSTFYDFINYYMGAYLTFAPFYTMICGESGEPITINAPHASQVHTYDYSGHHIGEAFYDVCQRKIS